MRAGKTVKRDLVLVVVDSWDNSKDYYMSRDDAVLLYNKNDIDMVQLYNNEWVYHDPHGFYRKFCAKDD